MFDDQDELLAAFKAGELDRDFVAVVRFQGPRANGMPELHKLTPPLGVLQDRGLTVALVTDGRMSRRLGQGAGRDPRHARGAGRRPAARVRDGDIIRLDAPRPDALEARAAILRRRAPGRCAAAAGRRRPRAVRDDARTGPDGAEHGALGDARGRRAVNSGRELPTMNDLTS